MINKAFNNMTKSKSKIKTLQRDYKFGRFDLFTAIMVFLIPLYFYVKTLCPTLSSYADAGEFPTAAYLTGFAHPPGYPLYTLLLKLFMLLPFGTNPAQKANLASAFIAAVGVAIFYLLAKNLTKKTLPSFFASMMMAFSPIYWRNAVVSEVFGLLVLFCALTYLLFIKWIETKSKKFYYWFLLVCGFGIAHHQLLIFSLIPLFIYFLVTKKWRLIKFSDVILGLLVTTIGFLPYLYVYFYASRHLPVMNWENPSTLNGLGKLILRDNYGTFVLTNESTSTSPMSQFLGILKVIFDNYQSLAVLLAFTGVIYLISTKRWWFLFYVFFVLGFSIFFTTYSGMPVWDNGQIQYLERFLLLGHVHFSLLIAFGIFITLQILSKPKIIYILSIAAIGISIIFYLSGNYKKVNQGDNYFSDRIAKDFFLSLPENSILVMEGDSVINNLLYRRFVLGERKDVTLVLGGLLSLQKDWYLSEVKNLYPSLQLPQEGKNAGEFLSEFIKTNSQYKPVYLYIPTLEADLGMSFLKTNQGLVWRYVDNTESVDINEVVSDIEILLAKYENTKTKYVYDFNSPEYTLLNLYIQPYVYLARLKHDSLIESEKYYQKVIELKPDNTLARIELGDDYLAFGKEAKAIKMWREALLYLHDESTKKELEAKIAELENAQL